MPIASLRPPRKPARTRGLRVLGGMGIALALHLAAFGAASLVRAPEVFLFIGVVQIVYLGPAWGVLAWHGKRQLALGVVIAAAGTFLLNSACVAVVANSL